MWIWIPVSILMLFLAVSFGTYYIAFYSPQKGQNTVDMLPPGEQYLPMADRMHTLIRDFVKIPFEEVYTTSFDGLKLYGRYYEVSKEAPLAICFHGYRSTGQRDFSGGGSFLIKEGFNLLLIDERAQGNSEGHTITFGICESRDVFSWLSYAENRFGKDKKTLLFGVSMGAATLLMASEISMPANVKGIIADSPYLSPKEIICKVAKDLHLPAKLLYPFIATGAFLFGGFRLSKGNGAAAVRKATTPILIIHGEDDRFVPCEMSENAVASNPQYVKRETFPGAAHGISFLCDTERYTAIARDFIGKALA